MTLDELIDLYTPEISEAFRLAIADVVDNVVLADVTRAIELGDPIAAFRALGFSDAAMRPLTAKLEQAFEAGGVATGATFPKRIITNAGPTVYRFDMRNSRAERWVREQSGELITRITTAQRNTVQTRMFEGLQAGNNPKTIATDIVGRFDRVAGKRVGGIIGLNEPQERAVAAMRQDLMNLDNNYFTRTRRDASFDSVVRKMFEDGEVSSERIDQLTARYKDRLLKLRGDTIARDAAMEALNRSEYEALLQAVDLGAVNNDATTRIWDSAGDDGRTRDDHLAMDGQEVGLNEAFTAPDGSELMHPQDRSMGAAAEQTVNCRCRVRTKVDWLKELD